MVEIEIRTVDHRRYQVTLRENGGQTVHDVVVSYSDLERFGALESPERLIEASFRFLLEREPKEAILASFDLGQIAAYYPEYPAEIRERIR